MVYIVSYHMFTIYHITCLHPFDKLIQVAAERGGYGAERYEKLDFQVEVAKQYRLLQDPTWQNIDASKTIAEVQEMIREASLKVISECKNGKELKHLWESSS